VADLSASVTPTPRLVRACRGIKAKVTLIDDTRIICITAGLLAPRIIISTGTLDRLDDAQLLAALAHEAGHVKRRDPLRAGAVRAAGSAFFYVPLIHHLANTSLESAELGADASATAVAGRNALVGALLGLLGGTRPAGAAIMEMAGSYSLEARIQALQTKSIPPLRPPRHVVVSSAFAIVAICALAFWLPPIKTVRFTPVTRIYIQRRISETHAFETKHRAAH
jgi:beta-lactamase regulating signal transducer with metallopeptidase domain